MNRDRLLKKREELKARLETSDRLSRIEDLIHHFDKHGIAHRVHIECEKVNSALRAYPTGFSGLDWDKIPNSKKIAYSSIDERNDIISTVITQYLELSDKTFIAWGDGAKPIVEITANQAAENSGAMADEDFDMWVLNLEKGFCLEHYHEGYVAWTIAS